MTAVTSTKPWAVALIGLAVVLVSAPVAGAAEPDWHAELRHNELRTVAGTGDEGTAGDGGPAVEAQLGGRLAIDIGPDGTLYVADRDENVLRKVSTDGLISAVEKPRGHLGAVAISLDGSVVAASSYGVWRVDVSGAASLLADFVSVTDIDVDAEGNIYLAESSPGAVHKIAPDGAVTTIAGEGDQDIGAIDGPVAAATVGLDAVPSIAVDSTGMLYFSHDPRGSESRDTVHSIAPDGTLTTLVAGRSIGFSGDGGLVASARFGEWIGGLAVGVDDTLYIADSGNGFVRRVGPDGVVTTIGPAVASIADLAVSSDATIHVVAAGAQVLAFTASQRLPGASVDDSVMPGQDPWRDEEPGTRVRLVPGDDEIPADDPSGTLNDLAVGPDGTLVVVTAADDGSSEVLRRSEDGELTGITTPLPKARRVQALADGGVIVADHNLAWRVHPDGASQLGGWGGHRVDSAGVPSAMADVEMVGEIAAGPDGHLFLEDALARVIYRVDPAGVLTTFVEEVQPQALTVAPDGTLYVADARDVLAVEPDGTVSTVAIEGPAHGGFQDVAVGADGTLYVSDAHEVIRIDADGDRLTVADDGLDRDVPGDGFRIAADAHGNLYVGDRSDGSVEVIVRPAEMSGPFPWGVVGGGAGALAVVTLATVVITRRARR